MRKQKRGTSKKKPSTKKQRKTQKHIMPKRKPSMKKQKRGTPKRKPSMTRQRETQKTVMPKTPLGPMLRGFFYEYLVSQRDLSPQTIASYRDTFRLLLRFLERQYRIKPDAVCVEDLDSPCMLMFLEDLEQHRGNVARSRNARRAAIHSFFRYALTVNLLLLPVAQRVLAIPVKRFERPTIGYLTRKQMQAILDSPDTMTFSGQRDRVLLMLLYNTGARVSEIAGLQIQDVSLESRMSIHIRGKGRKNRSIPLWRQTAKLLRVWLRQLNGAPNSPLLPNARDKPMTRAGIAQRLTLAVKRASQRKALDSVRISISPHTIRHTTAMHLLQSDVGLSVIAMWLGHESIQTTHQYLEADLEAKKRALACLNSPRVRKSRSFRADDIMRFLKGL